MLIKEVQQPSCLQLLASGDWHAYSVYWFCKDTVEQSVQPCSVLAVVYSALSWWHLPILSDNNPAVTEQES